MLIMIIIVKMFMMMIIVKVFMMMIMMMIMVKMFIMMMIMVKMFMKITLCGAAHHLRVSHIVSRCFHCGRRAPKQIFYLSCVM